MRFRDPDAAVLAWAEASGSATSPKSVGLRTVRIYAKRCSNDRCGGIGTRTTVRNRRGEVVERCSRCGTAWHWWLEYAPADGGSARAGSKGSTTVERAADLGAVISRELVEPDGEFALYVAHVRDGHTVRSLAEIASELRFKGHSWTRHTVWGAIERSRERLAKQLRRRGWLDEEDRSRVAHGGSHA